MAESPNIPAMEDGADWLETYKAAKRELSDLMHQFKQTERRIVAARFSLYRSRRHCEHYGLSVDPSKEATFLLKHSTLADEIRALMKFIGDAQVHPKVIQEDLVRLGHDMCKYKNPQATIQMILKRMVDSGEVVEDKFPAYGKKAYRYVTFNFDDLVEREVEASKKKINKRKKKTRR